MTTSSPFGNVLFTVMGKILFLNSSFATSIGSKVFFLTNAGAPREICKALAPINLATSNLVNLSFGQIKFITSRFEKTNSLY